MNPCSSQIRKLVAFTVSLAVLGFVLLGTAAIALHAGTPPQGAPQTAPLVSRTGPRVSNDRPIPQNPVPEDSLEAHLYTFTFGLIDFPRSQVSGAWAINDHGKIVSGYNNTNLEIYTADHGYALKGNTFSTIDYPGAVQTDLFGINKSGQMVGAFEDTSGNIHGFKLAAGIYTQLDYPGAKGLTVASGINASGEVVGLYDDPITGNAVGFLLISGVYTSISVPGATFTYLNAINKTGVIAGYYFDTSMNSHGFTWNKGTITTIDYGNGYPNTYLSGINDSGVIVGGYGTNMTIGSISYPWEHGFLYSSGTFSTFDAPFGDVQVTQPWGMNNNGEVVGGYVDSQGMLYGFYAKATP